MPISRIFHLYLSYNRYKQDHLNMKLIIVFLLSVFSIQNGLSQTESLCPCEHLNTSGEARLRKTYKNKPCLLDFVKANISDSSLIQFAGKKADYVKFNQKYCDESKAIHTHKRGVKKERITISKERFFMSEEKIDFDTTFFEEDDMNWLTPVSIEKLPYLGVQMHVNLKEGVLEEQNVVSEIKIEWNRTSISISLDQNFLLFNANFCKENEYGLVKPIEVFDIGDNKLAIYFHGNPYDSFEHHGNYIAKVIVDKRDGYIGTIYMHDYDLEAYGWMRCKDFQGF